MAIAPAKQIHIISLVPPQRIVTSKSIQGVGKLRAVERIIINKTIVSQFFYIVARRAQKRCRSKN